MSCSAMPDAASCRACVRQGAVQGATQGDVCAYLGIPYAKPPVGALRFTAPEPAGGWTDVRDATNFAAACVQSSLGVPLTGGAPLSEDCLYINVWTAAKAASERLPVLVYIYGGGYSRGATNTYIGTELAQKGPAVIVSMNYRVGPIGFFAHPELDEQRTDKPSGSDGIRDQQLALQWVQDNIASFGGDPENVTLFGESAGSAAVGIHLVSPGSRGLVRRYIMQSGVSTRAVSSGIEPVTRERMYQTTNALASALCPGAADVLACLRELPWEMFVDWTPPPGALPGVSGPMLPWVPTVEGPGGVLPESADALMESGRFNPGEILVGTNKNEFGFFQLIGTGPRVMNVDQMRMNVESQFGSKAPEIMNLYEPDDAAAAPTAYAMMMTDIMFRCGTRSFARLAAAQGRDVYLYSFEEGNAYHSEELAYVWGMGNFSIALNAAPTPALIDPIQKYWLNFARTGDPNGSGLPEWPQYDAEPDRHLTLVNPPAAGSGLQKEGCDYWDAYLRAN